MPLPYDVQLLAFGCSADGFCENEITRPDFAAADPDTTNPGSNCSAVTLYGSEMRVFASSCGGTVPKISSL